MSAPDSGSTNMKTMTVGLVSAGVAGILIFYAAGQLDSLVSSQALTIGAEVAVAGLAGGWLAKMVNQSMNY